MFFHAYNHYINDAYPADELMPLSCKGRFRGKEPPRGTVDEALGNFSLSLIDSLDTLFIMGEFDEFERAIVRVIRDVSFDQNHDVSIFETTIRVLGGLLGGHVSVLALKESDPSRMSWYKNELLKMAVDLGNRLLPAFNTSTGLPFPHINLHTGEPVPIEHTCTACAGTLILEFAALSRFSGDPTYETLAANALSYLWQQRNRYSDLVGTVINVSNGDWIRRESGVGAGIDSYYESLLKAYGLLGDLEYLHRFQTHYSAVKRYLGSPGTKAFPFSFLSVFMHRPSERARYFMDSLQAFWPGLQTIIGDLDAAVAHHEMLYMVHKKYGLLPEAFTTDMDIYWPYHLNRPELVESTYHLYKNTLDPYYLNVGAELLESIERYSRVPCGFAAIKDIRTMEHSDRMDSFVLAETFKYFYLLFSDPAQLPIDMDHYVLTTEAHILPIGLPRDHPPVLHRSRVPTESTPAGLSVTFGWVWGGSCPAPDEDNSQAAILRRLLIPERQASTCPAIRDCKHLEEIRRPLRNMVKGFQNGGVYGEKVSETAAPISAAAFNANNISHLQMLRQMGIAVTIGYNGELQLRLNRSMADTPLLGLSGLKFIEEVIDLNNARSQENTVSVHPHQIALIHPPHFGRTRFDAGPSMFTYYPGETAPPPDSASRRSLADEESEWEPVVGPLVIAEPFDACSPVYADGLLLPNQQLHADLLDPSPFGDPEEEEAEMLRLLLKGAIVLVRRGGCMFMDKAKNVKQMGARGVIIVDNNIGTTSAKDKLFYMSGDSPDGTAPKEFLQIPFVFIYHEEGRALVSAMIRRWKSDRKPAVAMIAKRGDNPKILTHGLRYLDESSGSSEQCHELSTRVEVIQSLCLQKETIRVDEIREEGEDDVDGWSVTLGPVENTDSFVAVNESSGQIVPNDLNVWTDFVDRSWPTEN
ncbi:hypothetical protein Aperf_G00000021965 [Anoplocephala perfoliata]